MSEGSAIGADGATPSRPLRWTLADLRGASLSRPVVWASKSVRKQAESLGWPLVDALTPSIVERADTLVAIGGGTMLDEAKQFRGTQAPRLKLIAVPSLWGSGAEASPVTVLTREGKKQITIEPKWLPDARVVWPELLATVTPRRAREACGDVWAHALEGFLSPLAKDDVRAEGAALLRDLLTLPLGVDARWLDVSAQACALQARSSVGLVHGLAHVLEGPLAAAMRAEANQPVDRQVEIGHAALCATFLWPVLRFNRAASDKLDRHAAQWALDLAAIEATLRSLHDATLWTRVRPLLESHWPQILRDVCTRTNCTLVRPSSLPALLEAAA